MVIPIARTVTAVHPDNFDEKESNNGFSGKVVQKEIRSVYGSGACPSFWQSTGESVAVFVDTQEFLTVD